MKSRMADYTEDVLANIVSTEETETYVNGDPVVPQHNGVRLPLSPDLAVNATINVVVQEVQDRV